MKHDDSVTLYMPKMVYNMRANSSGDIIELLSPIFKSKYGDVFDNTSNDYLGNIFDVVYNLLALGVYTKNIEGDKFTASKDGVEIEVDLIDGETMVKNLSNQILFLLKEFRIEQQQILKKTSEYTIERMGNYQE